MRQRIWISLALVALLLSGCRQPPGENVVAPVAPKFDVLFDGTIDNRLNIQMKLQRDADKLTGQYFYEKTQEETGARQYIELSGQVSDDGMFTLSESDGTKETGAFQGKLASENSSLRMSGTWSKAGDSKSLPFSALERRLDLDAGLTLKRAEQKDENKKLKYTVSAAFPQLEGDTRVTKFNQAVNDLVAGQIKEFKEGVEDFPRDSSPEGLSSSVELGYDITAGNKSVLSVLFNVGSYVEGAAHPNSNILVLNYDLTAGKTLELSDLFKDGSNYLRTISEYCLRSLARRDVSEAEWRERGAGAKAENYENWNLVRGGLLISFEAYQVASYAEGPQEVFIPFSALKEIIRADGPAASLMK